MMGRAVDERWARDWAEARLRPGRLVHVAGVAALADELASRYGEDPAPLRLAAWLHDLLKEEEGPALAEEAVRRQLPPELQAPFLLHAAVMGARARDELGFPPELWEAITYHPIGRPGLGRAGEILYLADKLEVGRLYDGVEELRRLARRDLKAGLLATVEAIVAFEQSQSGPGRAVHPLTLAWMETLRRG